MFWKKKQKEPAEANLPAIETSSEERLECVRKYNFYNNEVSQWDPGLIDDYIVEYLHLNLDNICVASTNYLNNFHEKPDGWRPVDDLTAQLAFISEQKKADVKLTKPDYINPWEGRDDEPDGSRVLTTYSVSDTLIIYYVAFVALDNIEHDDAWIKSFLEAYMPPFYSAWTECERTLYLEALRKCLIRFQPMFSPGYAAYLRKSISSCLNDDMVDNSEIEKFQTGLAAAIKATPLTLNSFQNDIIADINFY